MDAQAKGHQQHISPHHQPLPAQYQTTEKGRSTAEAYYSKDSQPQGSPIMANNFTISDLLPLPNSSVKIPRIGFGIYLSSTSVCVASCLHALKTGYRHIDSAQFYANEKEMGEAVRQSGLSRSDVFLTTKILSAAGSLEATYKKCLQSVEKIDDGMGKGGSGEGKGFLDLFLIHSASSGTQGRKMMWQALERLYEEGRLKAIGVSNFGVGHIEEMKDYAKVWPPHVNQIELHPFCQQRTIVDYCNQHKIIIEAYSPIVRNQKAHDPTLTKLAKAYGKSVSQVLIRYCLQKGWVPLPKSDTPSRIEENANVYDFDLSSDDMSTLDGLDQGDRGAIVEAVRN